MARTASIIVALAMTAGIVSLTSGCAVRPPQQVSASSHNGVYAPGAATIGDDGKFTVAARVWSEAELSVAREASIERLAASANARGFAYVIFEDEARSAGFGYRYALNGRLYRAGAAPSGAWPLKLIAEAADNIGQAYVPVVIAKPAAASTVAPAENEKIEETEPADEPEVIEAPEIISGRVAKKPLG